MEEQFITLQQKDRTVNEYAAEFLRLRRFAPYIVTNEENRANRFQQGLKMNIQMFLIPEQLKTYSQSLTIAHEVERGLEKKNQKKIQKKLVMQSLHSMESEDSIKHLGELLTLCPPQPPAEQITCEYCRKPGHFQVDCWKAKGLCVTPCST